MNRERLVMIGNGMAGVACLEQLLRHAPERYDITVFGDEPHPNYNRILLSSVLSGDADKESITLNPRSWYEEHGITLHLGERVEAIDREAKLVTGSKGARVEYDKLIVATGSRAFVIPVPGKDKPGVHVFRTLEDCEAMATASRKYKRAAVIGGGLLGLEAAKGLKNLGMDVTVVHLMDRLMERQLDSRAGSYLLRAIRAQGIDVRLEMQTEEIFGEERVEGLRFKGGELLAADLVVMAAGIQPNSGLAKTSGLECNRGIVVDDLMQTSDPDIHALGECAEHRGVCYGLVAPLYEQGRVLAAHLADEPTNPYAGSAISTKLKVSGIAVFSAGDFTEDDDCEVICNEDSGSGVYKKAVIRDGRLAGAVLVGDTSVAATLERLIRDGKILNGERATLLGTHGPAAGSESGESGIGAMPDDAIICGCNGVSKGAIVGVIKAQNLMTRKEVAGCCGASRSCGGCGEQVDALIKFVHGDSVDESLKKPLCDCTALTRDEVVEAIRADRLTSVMQVMRVLGWGGEGCAYCRPAINYFLTMCWPGENEDDPSSRFINERVHANIQRDGTFSVVPRMYGGVTTPDELIRIGKVARKYNVPTVKITGGQRIDLLGVDKEDLPRIWADLDMPSGFAYAKAVRTVKTCVGSDFCRFGTRDSIGMGIRIEKFFENLWTPAKIKMAVNACPRNCAEALIKDVGLIGVEKEWEIYIGGNGGVKVRQAELLCSVPTDDEAIEIIAAFLQLYREQANYNERTSVWCERVGLEWVQHQIVQDASARAELAARMNKALENRVEPWRERAKRFRRNDDEAVAEFEPLAMSNAS